MANKLLGVCFLLFFIYFTEGQQNGVCSRKSVRTVMKTVIKSKLAHYRKSHCVFRCIKTRMETYIDSIPVTQQRIIYECCDGYLQNGTTPDQVPICIPQCEPPCTNGACVEPNTCKCDSGFEFKNGTCQPICSKPCNNGTCIAPEVCKCLPGYRESDVNVCAPVCSRGCYNGTCSSPEVCECENGWQLTNNSICEPKCDTPCQNGVCIAPNTCSCNDGYEPYVVNMMNETICEPQCSPSCNHGVCTAPNFCSCYTGFDFKNETCEPVCSEPCNNGTCVEPDMCKCFSGYKMTDVNVCTPVCSEGCQNGSCISPEVCYCEEGWELTNGTTCMPTCDSCENGVCVAPNICKCDPGYELNIMGIGNLTACEPKCTSSCDNGACIAPEVCVCNPGYELKNGTCQPVCSKPCHNGTCTEPEYCTCFSGYYKDFSGVCEFEESFVSNSTVSFANVTREEEYGGRNFSADRRTIDDEHKSAVPWIYCLVPVLALLSIITVILIWKRNTIVDHFTGGSYAVADNKAEKNNIPDIKFSAILERKAKSEASNVDTL